MTFAQAYPSGDQCVPRACSEYFCGLD